MALWSGFLEIVQTSLFGLTHFYGGHLGAAIVSLSLLARLALLPLSVRLALRTRAHARRLRMLQPALARVRERWKDDPTRAAEESLAVYRRTGVKPVDGGALGGALLQTPIFIALFQAVRAAVSGGLGRQGWLWISSLARPDLGVALIAAALAGTGVVAAGSGPRGAWMPAVSVLLVGAMALATSAGFGLYLAASGAVQTLQGLVVRRIEARAMGVGGGLAGV